MDDEQFEIACRAWERYYVNCETYDRGVCTGPIGRDGILPADSHELGLIGSNALGESHKMRKEFPEIADEIWDRAKKHVLGYLTVIKKNAPRLTA